MSDSNRPATQSTNDNPQLVLRRVAVEDAEAVATLSVQLGYEASSSELLERIARLSSCGESQVVFVACLGTQLVGWIEAAITYHLQSAPFVLIGGLVIREGLRGLGIGKRLGEEVEAWTRQQGIKVLRVTSRSTRADAHRFYLRDGFTEVKISKVFEKLLL